MTYGRPKCNLFPAGYLIVQESSETRRSDNHHQNFDRYCGVGRLPPFIAPDPEVRKLAGEPLIEDARLYSALDEWFDSHADTTAFISNEYQAYRLVETLRFFDYPLELLYCQLALIDGEEARLDGYTKVEGDEPVTLITYGFDISWPTCNHSAIVQPGVVTEQSAWPSKLNRYGLLDDFGDAMELREQYLRVYPYPPFDIFLVHRVS